MKVPLIADIVLQHLITDVSTVDCDTSDLDAHSMVECQKFSMTENCDADGHHIEPALLPASSLQVTHNVAHVR